MEIPTRIVHGIGAVVAHQLSAELGSRGLLITADELAASQDWAAQCGARLLIWTIHRHYQIEGIAAGAGPPAIRFESEAHFARIEAALAFGAVTARVLVATSARNSTPLSSSAEPICAIFNLGIGLVDSLCDHDAEAGVTLLICMREQDMGMAAEDPRPRGWLRTAVPPALRANATVAFTVEMIEEFFVMLHELYPAESWRHLRRSVGVQLVAALEAEHRSVNRSGNDLREDLIECSRLTSVLPFQVIQILASGNDSSEEPWAGTQLGEAMWRIDDLVDLCQDALSESLNGVLLGVATSARRPVGPELVAALERLLISNDIARSASEAAENLQAGLAFASIGAHTAEDRMPMRAFLSFIQRYAGIAPRPSP